jgi:hypothetical protein
LRWRYPDWWLDSAESPFLLLLIEFEDRTSEELRMSNFWLMKITPQQQNEMLAAAKPLIKWMNDNCHPHCEATVSQDRVELLEGVATQFTSEFAKDSPTAER